MKNTQPKINYIAEYLGDYLNKVKILNKQGLFDEAKHFELFSIELSRIWFGQEFNNSNAKRFNEPYIDLVSKDSFIYIQVSTVADIEAKIDGTLQKINECDLKNKIKSLKFILLNNDDISKIKLKNSLDFFSKDNDIINIGSILKKAGEDKAFCDNLYDLVFDKFTGLEEELKQYDKALDKSKHDVNQINITIGSTYEIDRAEIINEIKSYHGQNILILGQAGSGKTVTCKLLLKDHTTVLFSRAESFVSCSRLDDIWGFDFELILNYLGDTELVIFIDSLEFIADNFKKTNLLSYLFEKCLQYRNIKIFMTCRTSDSSAFMALNQDYSIKTFEIFDLTDGELNLIKEKFPILNQLSSINAYTSLLNNPWYINMITENITDLASIKNENDLRQKIWEDVICKDKKDLCDITIRRDVISHIILTRALEADLYVAKDELDVQAVKSLLSDNILIESNDKNGVRVKYDIFEDIFFERVIDSEFLKSKGDYAKFFSDIEKFGKCVYRRYQIWVANKLWEKDSQESFIQHIVFSTAVPEKWREQTMIGIIKARNSATFFDEYKGRLTENDNKFLLCFIRLVNLYGFEIDFKFKSYLKLKPSGEARANIIKLICDTKAYQDNNLQFLNIKLVGDWCSNLHWQQKLSGNIANHVKEILLFYINNELASIDKKFHDSKEFIKRLKLLYIISDVAKDEIKSIWKQLTDWCKLDDENYKRRFAEEVIHEALIFDNYALVNNLPQDLCDLANFFWRLEYYHPKKERDPYGFYTSERRKSKPFHDWGLNDDLGSRGYGNYEKLFWYRSFFYPLLQTHFFVGLKFIINFINQSVEIYQKNNPDYLNTYKLFLRKGEKEFLGNGNLWAAYRGMGNAPQIIQDMLMSLESFLLTEFRESTDDKALKMFAIIVRETIFIESNNIAPLPIVLSLGIKFIDKLGDYALELASDINIVMMDLQRLGHDVSGLATHYVGMLADWQIKNLQEHHEQNFRKLSLQAYVRHLQGQKDYKDKVNKLLDNLYSTIPNDEENASEFFNIQKMDLRKFEFEDKGDYLVGSPKTDGAVKKMTEEHSEIMKPFYQFIEDTNKIIADVKEGKHDINEVVSAIDGILQKDQGIIIANNLNDAIELLVIFALKDKNLKQMKREEYIDLVLSHLQSVVNIDRIGVPGFEAIFSKVQIFKKRDYFLLWPQLYEDISDKCKNKIKKSMFSLLMNGDLSIELVQSVREFLAKDKALEKEFLNTMIAVAKYEAETSTEFWKKRKESETYEEYDFNLDDAFDLCSKKLLTKIDLDFIDEGHVESHYLFAVFNLDLTILEKENYQIFERLLDYLATNIERDHGGRIHYDSQYAFRECLERNLLVSKEHADKVVDLMFDNKDFDKFSRELVKFYEATFAPMIRHYFNAHSNVDARKLLYNIWSRIEEKIKNNSVASEKLFNCLIFTREDHARSWEDCKTYYSLNDKSYINIILSEYGKYDISQAISNVRNLKVDELLPEILLSIEDILSAKSASKERKIQESKKDLIYITSKAFFNHRDKIKSNIQLSSAFESILEILVDAYFAEAAVILDEFRIH